MVHCDLEISLATFKFSAQHWAQLVQDALEEIALREVKQLHLSLSATSGLRPSLIDLQVLVSSYINAHRRVNAHAYPPLLPASVHQTIAPVPRQTVLLVPLRTRCASLPILTTNGFAKGLLVPDTGKAHGRRFSLV